MTALPPVRRAVRVAAAPDEAFRIFTDRIGSWWPLARLSVFGAGATVSFADGELVEVSPAGDRSTWGTVTDWMPGESVAFTWHPGGSVDVAGHVAVSFEAESDAQTLVTLVHTGWESYADPASSRAGYDRGWPTVLADFAESVRDAAPRPAPR